MLEFLLIAVSILGCISANASNALYEDYFLRWQANVLPQTKRAFYDRFHLNSLWKSALVPGLEKISGPNQGDLEKLEVTAGQMPEVIYLQPNYHVVCHLIPMVSDNRLLNKALLESHTSKPGTSLNDPLYPQQWALVGPKGIHPERAWKKNYGFSGGPSCGNRHRG